MGAQSPVDEITQRLQQACKSTIDEIAAGRLLVAYSGGMDSHVLLHVLSTLYPADKIYAIHINHQQSSFASEWVEKTRAVCESLGVHYCEKMPPINCPSGASLENVLREARYVSFAESLTESTDVICLAHHADDQAETVLMRLLRGAGPTGLSGMRVSRSLGAGVLCRPFLSVSRAQLHAYAGFHQLQWVEDESNQDQRFDRNYLRQTVMPLLKARWPSLEKTIVRAADHCHESNQCLSQLLRVDCPDERGPLPWTQQLRAKDSQYQALVIRQWLSDQQVQPPPSVRLADFLRQLSQSKQGALPVLHMRTGEIRYYRDSLYFESGAAGAINQGLWDRREPFLLGEGLGQLRLVKALGQGLSCERLPKQLSVQVRAGQASLQISAKGVHQSLKNLWQHFGVPPWLRSAFPLVFNEGKLLAIPGFACDAEWSVAAGEYGWVIVWEQCPHVYLYEEKK